MKILLICTSGITTGIFSNKLQKYSDELKKGDDFFSTRIGFHQKYIKDVDLIFLAPQANSYFEAVKTETDAMNKKVYMLSEEDLVFSKVDSIYKIIEENRTIGNETKSYYIHVLSKKDYLNIIKKALTYCFPIIVLLMIFLIGSTFIPTLNDIVEVCVSIFGMFLAFSMGYSYGEELGDNKLEFALVVLSASFIMIPINHVKEVYTPFFKYSNGYIGIASLGLNNCLWILFYSIVCIMLLNLIQKKIIILSRNLIFFSNPLTKMSLNYGFIFIVFLILREIQNFLLYIFL